MFRLLTFALVVPMALSPCMRAEQIPHTGTTPGLGNPILPGYFADPSLVSHDGLYFLYATIDPWGGETLGCWESADFRSWTYRELNWPTKRACTSPTSRDAKVWAPSVVRAADGRFFMYVSVGNEIWVGRAAHPLGPWEDANGGKPLIPENFRPGFHMIDAEAFLDDDGEAYLYWGSGWNWVNGKCWAVRLKPDMVGFASEVRDVTPARYFEAPFMVKHAGRYYLMYSDGKTTEDSYQVHYAIGDSPLGPFAEAENSPCLVTDAPRNILSPGHHAVFQREGRHHILYHRHSIPFDPEFIGRQICVDPLVFREDGLIETIRPSHEGPEWVRRDIDGRQPHRMTASCALGPHTTAAMAADDNHATRWAAGSKSREAWLRMDLGGRREIGRQELRFEFPTRTYRFVIEHSLDEAEWTVLADHRQEGLRGSPVVLDAHAETRFLRLRFADIDPQEPPAVFEWRVR